MVLLVFFPKSSHNLGKPEPPRPASPSSRRLCSALGVNRSNTLENISNNYIQIIQNSFISFHPGYSPSSPAIRSHMHPQLSQILRDPPHPAPEGCVAP